MTFNRRLTPIVTAMATLAVIWPMTQAELERALSIGRAFDSERARFHQAYAVPVTDPTIEHLEVVTEFRRAVLWAEEQIRRGDHMFGVRQAESALSRWHGKVTIEARLRFHPMNTFVMVPDYDVMVGEPPLTHDVRRTPLYAGAAANQPGNVHQPLAGAVIEADYEAEAVGQARRPVAVVLNGRVIVKTVVDFSQME
jgi:hypothetical protein